MIKIRKRQAPAPLTRACPRQISKSWRFAKSARHVVQSLGAAAKLDRYTGCYWPHYNRHDALDGDKDVQEKVRNGARAVAGAALQLRAGDLAHPDRKIKWRRTKLSRGLA